MLDEERSEEEQRVEAEMKRLRMDDPYSLPRQAEVAKIFGLGGGSDACGKKFVYGPHGQMTCSCAVCVVWKRFVSGQLFGQRVYEILTVELIQKLAAHLWGRSSPHIDNTILEIGAGSGRLSYFLAQELNAAYECKCELLPLCHQALPHEQRISSADASHTSTRHRDTGKAWDIGVDASKKNRRFQIACTDSSARGLGAEIGDRFPVEVLGYQEALNKYSPNTVLACWMELGHDWTAAFRQTSSMVEYILIGEADSGVCGR